MPAKAGTQLNVDSLVARILDPGLRRGDELVLDNRMDE